MKEKNGNIKNICYRYITAVFLIMIFLPMMQNPIIIQSTVGQMIQTDDAIILVTGFGPWHTNDINPSGLAAIAMNNTTINEYKIIGFELPVDFQESVDQMVQAIDTYEPDLIISLGLAANAKNIRVEILAINIRFDSLADKPFTTLRYIDKDGPLFLRSTLTIDESVQAIKQYTPSIKSYSAGLYICNTLFYQTIRYLNEHDKDIPMGFIHVPQITPTNPDGINLETIIHAIEACILANIT